MTKPQTSPVRFLTADDILTKDDIKWEDVDVPEWGGVVRVVGLSGDERDSFEESALRWKQERGKNGKVFRTREMVLRGIRAKLVAKSAVAPGPDAAHPIGVRLFTDQQADALGLKSAKALNRLFTVAQELSGLSDEQLEELATDLGNGQSGAGGSG